MSGGMHSRRPLSSMEDDYEDEFDRLRKLRGGDDAFSSSSKKCCECPPDCCQGLKDGGCRLTPRPACALACFGASVAFVTAINTDYLTNIGFPMIGNMLPFRQLTIDIWYEPFPLVVIIMTWGIHFLRRFGEVLMLHDYRRRFHWFEAVGVLVYYGVFGFWNGYACNIFTGYLPVRTVLLFPGVVVFLTGEIGNCYCHVLLRNFRRRRSLMMAISRNPGRHCMPEGRMFQHIACPHYLFEIVSWIGFFLVVYTLAAFVFLVVNIVIVMVYARLRLRGYRRQFDGQDGRHKIDPYMKALIPGVF